MHLLDLPNELLGFCCDHVHMLAARVLRLTCRRFFSLANKRLFSHLHLLPTADSARKSRAVLENSDLNTLVATISIQASLPDIDCELTPQWDVSDWPKGKPDYSEDEKHGVEIDAVLALEFKAMIDYLGLFDNLRRVELKHDWEVKTDDTHDVGNQREWVEYREAFFQHVLMGLNHPEHPAAKLDSLSICNLQDYDFDDIYKSHDFKTVLSRLRSLGLGIATESKGQESSEYDIEIREQHNFFGKVLLESWLEPVQQHLVHLKLYSNSYWGYLPKCDLRSLHFPNLKSLALGNMTFTHDFQLDWIISHGARLECLTLDDCPIVHDAFLRQRLDSEQYCILDNQGELNWDGDDVQWSYGSRWHNYFRALETGLPHLRNFGVGRGPWLFDWGEDCMAPAFDAAASLHAELRRSRYMVISHWYSGPAEWLEPNADGTYKDEDIDHREEEITWPRLSTPDCSEEDQKALDELMAAVDERK